MKKYIIGLTVLFSVLFLTLNNENNTNELTIDTDVNTEELSIEMYDTVIDEVTLDGITYKVVTDDVSGDYATVKKCSSTESIVEIKNEVEIDGDSYKVKTISSFAFLEVNTVETIIFPENIETINGNAFASCENLKEVNLVNSKLVELKDNAFFECTALKSITLPGTVERMGTNVFSGCTSLSNVYVNSKINGDDLKVSDFSSSASNLNIIMSKEVYNYYKTLHGDSLNDRFTRLVNVALNFNNNDFDIVNETRLANRPMNYVLNDDGTWEVSLSYKVPTPFKGDFLFTGFVKNDETNTLLDINTTILDDCGYTAQYQGLYDIEYTTEGYILTGINEYYISNKNYEFTSVFYIPKTYYDGNNKEANVIKIASTFVLPEDVKFIYVNHDLTLELGCFGYSNAPLIIAKDAAQYDSFQKEISGSDFVSVTNVTFVTTVTFDPNNGEAIIVEDRLYGKPYGLVRGAGDIWGNVETTPTPSKKGFLFKWYSLYEDSNYQMRYDLSISVFEDAFYKAYYQGLYNVNYKNEGYELNSINTEYLDAFKGDLSKALVIPETYDDGNYGSNRVIGLSDTFEITDFFEFIYLPIGLTYGELLFADNPNLLVIVDQSEYNELSSILDVEVTCIIDVVFKMNNGEADVVVERLLGKEYSYAMNDDSTWSINGTLEVPNSPVKDGFTFAKFIDESGNEIGLDYRIMFSIGGKCTFTAQYQGFYDVVLNESKTGYILKGVHGSLVRSIDTVLTIPAIYDDGNNGLKRVVGLDDNFSIPSNIKFLYLPNGLTYGNNLFEGTTDLLVITDKDTFNDINDTKTDAEVTYYVNVTINYNNGDRSLVLKRLYNKTINYVQKEDLTWSIDSDFELITPSKNGNTFDGYFDSANNAFNVNTKLMNDTEVIAKYTLIAVPNPEEGNNDDKNEESTDDLVGIAKLDSLIQEFDIILIIILSTANLLLFIIGLSLKTKKKNRQMVVRSTMLPILLVLSNSSMIVLALTVLILIQTLYIIYLLLTTNKLGIIEVISEEDEEVETTPVLQEPLPADAVLQEVVKEEVDNKDKELDYILEEDDEELPQILEVIEEDAPLRAILDVSSLDDSEEELDVAEADDEENELSESTEEEVTAKISSETGKMILIRYKKSFSARLNLSEDLTKDYHSAIKNKLLSYKKVKSRTSWNYEAFNFGRQQVAKMNIRGKSLFIYLPLDPQEYEDSKYSFKDCSHIKKYEQLPFRLRVRSNRGLKHAYELIEIVMQNFETTEIKDYDQVNYYQRNRGFEKLLSEGLIKEVIDETTFQDLTEINKEFLDSNKIKSIDLETIKDIKFSEDVMTEAVSHIKVQNTSGKKDIINIDTISKYYKDNEVVSIKTLKDKKLISPSVKNVKCLARGTLDKKLSFELQSYSKDAIKMIIITGGKII